MKVKSSVGISFPSLGWGIAAGEEKELPDDIAEEVLKQHVITKVDEHPVKESSKKEKINNG